MRNIKTLFTVILLLSSFLTIYHTFLNTRPQSYDWDDNYINFIPHILSLVVFSIVLIAKSALTNTQIRLTLIDILLLVLLVLCILSNLFAVGFLKSQTISFSTFITIYALIRQFKYVYTTSAIAYIIGTGLAIEIYLVWIQIKDTDPELWFLVTKGSLGNSGIFACFIGTTFIFMFILVEKYLVNKVSLISKCLMITLIVLLLTITQSRASAIAFLLITSCYLYIFHIKHYLPKTSKLLQFSGLGLFLMLLAAAAVYLYHLRPDSVTGRFLIYLITLQHIPEHFVLGIGYGNFPVHYPAWQAEYFTKNPTDIGQFIKVASITNESYNELLQLLVEIGIIGVALFSYLLCKVFNSVPIEGKERETSLLKLALLNVLLFSFFSYPFHSPAILLITISLLALISNNARDMRHSITIPGKKVMAIYSVAALSTVYAIIYLTTQAWAVKQWRESKETTTTYQQLDSSFNSVSEVLKNNGKFLKDYGKLHFINANYKKSISLIERSKKYYITEETYEILGKSYQSMGLLRKAEETFIYWSSMLPNRFTPKYYLLLLYIQEQRKDKAKKTAEEILAMSIKIPSSQVELIRAEARNFLSHF
jgi:O-antigen polymerase